MRHRGTARAIHLCGAAPGGGPHPHGVRAGRQPPRRCEQGAAISARVRDALEEISAINIELLSRGALG